MNKNYIIIALIFICLFLGIKPHFSNKEKGDFFLGKWKGGPFNSIEVKTAGQLYYAIITFESGKTTEYFTEFKKGCLMIYQEEQRVFVCKHSDNSVLIDGYELWKVQEE